jgi:hypothetical protein
MAPCHVDDAKQLIVCVCVCVCVYLQLIIKWRSDVDIVAGCRWPQATDIGRGGR